jgi:EAL and modified HD-GYP domain-containing signal transduction protein
MVDRNHLVRQPVLDAGQALAGYSLQVREHGVTAGHEHRNPTARSARALLNAVNSPSFGRLVGEHRVFADLPGEFLYQELEGFLPRQRSVMLLPQPAVEPGLEEGVRARHGEGLEVGFEVRCADGLGDAELLARAADYLRFDVADFANPSDLTSVVAPYRGGSARWLAANVHDQETFQRCRALGFSLFQGQFFTQPAVFASDAFSPRQTVLLELFGQLSNDAEFDDIEATFKRNPDLSHQLLELLNSAAFRRQEPIYSIRQCLVLLGKNNLRKWIALLLFAEDDQAGGSNPLFDEAVIRARAMELAAARIQNSDAFTGSAFLTGVFSVIQALLMRPMQQIARDLRLDRPIATALLERRGVLGELLATVEALREQRGVAAETAIGERTFTEREWFEFEEQAAFEYNLGG